MTFRRARSLAILLALAPAPALAQGVYQPVGVSDADVLAETVRRLGSNPLDLEALLTAGELSVRLEDLSAAGSFFARAEKIDPRSGRAKAGEGAILVRSQRPAEALRYFATAERLGFPLARFAGDRGLAYDLLGDPGRAQRDYRLALSARPDAETRRRYALSLGIAGRQAQALDELAPLVRQNDRAAWRTRAFVLAMSGDAVEAARIAQTMMPPGAAAGLRGFFAELPRLSPVDRAFAVHFGEVRPSAVRLADARLAPRDAPLALEPLPVRVAAVQSQPSAKESRRDRRSRRERERDRDRQWAQVAAASVPVAPPLPQPPAYQAPVYQPPRVVATTPVRDRPLSAGELASLTRAGLRNVPRSTRSPVPAPAYTTPPGVRPLTPAEQASLAAATLRPAQPRREPTVTVAATAPIQPLRRDPPVSMPARPAPNVATVAALASPPVSQPRNGAAAGPVAPAPVSVANVVPTTVPPSAAGSQPLTLAQADITPRQPAVAAPVALSPAPASVATQPVATAVVASPPAAVPVALAAAPPLAIVPSASAATSLAVNSPAPEVALSAAGGDAMPTAAGPAAAPASGTSVTALPEPPTSAPLPETTPAPIAVATSTPLAPLVTPSTVPTAAAVTTPPPAPRRLARGEGDSILAKIVANLTIPASELDVGGPAAAVPTRALGRRQTAEPAAKPVAPKTAAEKLAESKKAAADKKALAEKKAAADKKALADKEAEAERKLARGEPKRFWVQVAGGANESDLAKAWRTAQARAPALAGKSGWTTPLRATNRVLSGPFKTEAEARAHVNQLAKSGVSAFTFTSEPGQKVTKLAAK